MKADGISGIVIISAFVVLQTLGLAFVIQAKWRDKNYESAVPVLIMAGINTLATILSFVLTDGTTCMVVDFFLVLSFLVTSWQVRYFFGQFLNNTLDAFVSPLSRQLAYKPIPFIMFLLSITASYDIWKLKYHEFETEPVCEPGYYPLSLLQISATAVTIIGTDLYHIYLFRIASQKLQNDQQKRRAMHAVFSAFGLSLLASAFALAASLIPSITNTLYSLNTGIVLLCPSIPQYIKIWQKRYLPEPIRTFDTNLSHVINNESVPKLLNSHKNKF